MAGDHAVRCLPTDVAAATAFGDAQCTQRIAIVPAAPPGCPLHVPKYGQSFDYPQNGACEQDGWFYPTHVYPVGAFQGPDEPCYAPNGTSCQQTGCGVQGEYAVYALGSEIAPFEFVAGALTHD